ncbi:MAG: hypothetical protein ISS70_05800 [Phycisphaerae bacterium]|nr:hypothetical protein [Phycisphaerae bacterium]
MHYLEEVKKWLGEITEVFMLLIALGVIAHILFGETLPFFGSVVPNLTALIGNLGDDGLVGLIALGIIIYMFQRRKVLVHQQ